MLNRHTKLALRQTQGKDAVGLITIILECFVKDSRRRMVSFSSHQREHGFGQIIVAGRRLMPASLLRECRTRTRQMRVQLSRRQTAMVRARRSFSAVGILRV